MPLYTTYLGLLNRNDALVGFFDGKPKAIEVNGKIEKAEFLYVMRNRGNNAVAPSKELLKLAMEKKIDWECYKRNYLKELRSIFNDEPRLWMENVAEKSRETNIVLVCYEKDAHHCHRTLLAKEIVRRFPFVEFKGELEV